MIKQDLLPNLIVPQNREGIPDQRFKESLSRILERIGPEATYELMRFSEATTELEKQATTAGLKLAVAIFEEAIYLENNCRFDNDNQYGWRQKKLRKEAQSMIQAIGFKRGNAHKLVSTADWIARRVVDPSEREWLESLSPSHLYELSRMSDEGLDVVKTRVSYEGFRFCAGQQTISVRSLEQIRRSYPKPTKTEGAEDKWGQKHINSKAESIQISTNRPKLSALSECQATVQFSQIVEQLDAEEKIELLVTLANSINWVQSQQSKESMKSLRQLERVNRQITMAIETWNSDPDF